MVGHWLLATGLWFAAHAVASRQCLDNAYGLGVEGGGVTATEEGCRVDIPTTQGHLEVLLPTLHSGFAAAAAVLAALGAIWPVVLMVAFSRRAR